MAGQVTSRDPSGCIQLGLSFRWLHLCSLLSSHSVWNSYGTSTPRVIASAVLDERGVLIVIGTSPRASSPVAFSSSVPHRRLDLLFFFFFCGYCITYMFPSSTLGLSCRRRGGEDSCLGSIRRSESERPGLGPVSVRLSELVRDIMGHHIRLETHWSCMSALLLDLVLWSWS
ncbi:hypothetical protein VTI74DRAFT_945 [Chaetomium olivicolor]